MKQAVSFTEGSPGSVLYRMSIPMVWGLLATMSFNAVDTYFVAQLGADQLAAISFTFPVVMVVTSMAIGLGAGTASVMARLLGRREIESARQLAGDTLLLSVLLSILVMVVGLVSMDPLFTLLGADMKLLSLIGQYMQIWYFNAPFVLAPMALSAMMRATGNNKSIGILMVLSALANMVLDPILIFGWGPFPRMEMAGAALATLIVGAAMTACSLYLVARHLRLMSWPHRRWSELQRSWKSIFHIALPAMGTNMIIPLSSGITVALVAAYGVDAVAGYGIALRIEPVLLIAFYALSGVLGPFFGQNMEPENHHRQLQGLQVVTRFCLLFGVGLTILLWLFAESVAALFSDTMAVVSVAVLYLSIVPIGYGLYGLVMAVNACFNGLGQPFPAMTLSTLRVLIFYLPLVWLGQSLFGLQGLFLAIMLANMMAGVVAYLWIRSRLARLAKAP